MKRSKGNNILPLGDGTAHSGDSEVPRHPKFVEAAVTVACFVIAAGIVLGALIVRACEKGG